MQKLTITHVRNRQENRRRFGYGHLYQGATSRFLSKKTTIFTRSRGTWNGTLCGPISSAARRNGAGIVCGAECMELPNSRRSCPPGPCRSPPTGAVRSTSRRPRENSKQSAVAWFGANPMAAWAGSSVLQVAWAWNRPSAGGADRACDKKQMDLVIRPVPFVCRCPVYMPRAHH
jgi:hypothetical protein